MSKTDFLFRSVKLVSEIFYLFLAENGRLLFVLSVCLLQLCPILAPFFSIEVLIELRKTLVRKKLFNVQFGNCSTLKYPDSADLPDLQRCN